MLEAIGATPLVRLSQVVPTGSADVLIKLEGGNPTGSYKDRMALAIIEGAERRGTLQPGQRVVEFTGGSRAGDGGDADHRRVRTASGGRNRHGCAEPSVRDESADVRLRARGNRQASHRLP